MFVHILPDLSSAQTTVKSRLDENLSYLEHHAYLMALVGMLMFYGLERVARQSRQESREQGRGDYTHPGIFWLHMVSFALYNALIGYLLLHREEPGLGSLLIYAGAMALHFVVNDYGLREDHKKAYDHQGRWILAGAVIFGWVLGSQVSLSEAAIATLFAFLAGGIILNVLKEELPEENESRFWVFALGAGGYSALLLSL